MHMTIINRDTFTAERSEPVKWDQTKTVEIGTVETTLGHQSRVLPAKRYEDGSIYIMDGIAGRYVSGGKVWPATVASYVGKPEYVNFGRDDRSGRFKRRAASSIPPDIEWGPGGSDPAPSKQPSEP